MCLTEYSLARHCGLTFARCKVASLFTIYKEDLSILKFFSHKFLAKGIRFTYFLNSNNNLLLYVYHEESLHKTLFNEHIKAFLARYGYKYDTVDSALSILESRLLASSFPHEIGVFLGYPLEDVIGFTTAKETSLTHRYWRVYSDKEEKEKLFKRLDKCLSSILKKIESGITLSEIFLLN